MQYYTESQKLKREKVNILKPHRQSHRFIRTDFIPLSKQSQKNERAQMIYPFTYSVPAAPFAIGE